MVRVRQAGQMWKKPGARPLRFQATEDFSVDHVGFSWRARFPIAGQLAGNGELEWREVEARGVEVAAPVGSSSAVVQLDFDETGDVVRASGV